MKEIAIQTLPGGDIRPYSLEDKEALKEYKPYQIIRCKTYGAKKPRSLNQLRLYWVCCSTVAENNEDPMWRTKESVDFQCRVACDFRDKRLISVRPDNTVQFFYRSLSYANCSHPDATKYMTEAFEIMAKKIGITVDTLLENAE